MTNLLTTETASEALPGDLDAAGLVERIIRVDHAGEYGARRIYQGQLAVLERRAKMGKFPQGQPTLQSRTVAEIRHMAQQENRHLKRFEMLMGDRRVRPTALLPLWHVAGFALGAATALLGERAAMACTIAVEEVIEAHYQTQAAQLGPDQIALKTEIEEFRDEEAAHRATAEASGGRNLPGYEVLATAIKTGSRLAIWLSERL